MKPLLRIGAVINSHTPAAWVNALLQDVQNHELMKLTVAVHESHPEVINTSGIGKLTNWLLNDIIDIPRFSDNPWQASSLPDGITACELSDRLTELETCDVILYLSNTPMPEPLRHSKHTIWSADLPDLDWRIQNGLINRSPFQWLHLWSLNPENQGINAERIASHALPCQSFSISDLRRLCYNAIPSLFRSRLIWLANGDHDKTTPIGQHSRQRGVFAVDEQIALLDANNKKEINASPFSEVKTLAQVVHLCIRQLIQRVHGKLFEERWQLAVVNVKDEQRLDDIAKIPVHTYNCPGEAHDVLWADPHLCEFEGNTYVFFEKMHRHGEDAHIAYAKLDSDGRITESGPALTADYHLSFPYVFSHENAMYMVPETASMGAVDLYKASSFPDQWTHHARLLSDINAADSVLFQHEERWWMFTNTQSHRSVDERDELHVFYATNLDGPWQPHALNPVLTGVDRSRMAGPILSEDGVLYRTSQYGAYRYGYGINISRIDELTPQSYRETAVRRILPESGKGWSGCHSFAKLDGLAIIDRVRFSRK